MPYRYAQVDLIFYAFYIGDSFESNKPLNYMQACVSKHKHEWLKVMQIEMNSLHKNNIWFLVKKAYQSKDYRLQISFQKKTYCTMV